MFGVMKKFTLLILLLPVVLFGQKSKIDSLEKVMEISKTDTVKVRVLTDLALLYLRQDPEKSLEKAKQALAISEKLPNKKWKGFSLLAFGGYYKSVGELKTAIDYFNKALPLFQEAGNINGQISTLNGIGQIYGMQADFKKAEIYLDSALVLCAKSDYKKNKIGVLNNLAVVYGMQALYEKALTVHLEALKLRKDIDDKQGIAASYNNIGIVYDFMKQPDKALEYFQLSQQMNESIGDKKGTANSTASMANIYLLNKDYDKALQYLEKSLQMREEMKDKGGICASLTGIGQIYQEKKDFEKALEYFRKALTLAKELEDKENIGACLLSIGSMLVERGVYDNGIKNLTEAAQTFEDANLNDMLSESYRSLSSAYSKTKNFQLAYSFEKKYSTLRDSLMNNESQKRIAEMQTRFDVDAKDKENELLKQKNEIQSLESGKKDAEINKQKITIALAVVGLVMMVVLAFFIFREYRLKQKANVEISEQKEIIEEKNKNITDSINYAKRIQEALLPSMDLKQKLFPKSFIIFRPRDIVSGDFYWFSEKNNKKIIAAVDCTGHGVPGAFMSMIGTAFLNEIVNERAITQADLILSELRHLVIRALKQTGAEGGTSDGMDISILSFDEKNNTVEFAGANNPLWIFRNGNINEYSPDKRSIGYHQGKGLPFNLQKIDLQKNDSLYIFTDGYPDQFGGEKGKKFKYKQLKEKLTSICNLSCEEQKTILEKTFDNWKGNLEQVDDVLVIGIKV